MHLHVFNDPHGFILNVTVQRFIDAGVMERHQFLNLNQRTIYTHPSVVYLKTTLPAFKAVISKLDAVDSVSFYPFDYTAAFFLKELQKKFPGIPASWIFWSYEYYHRPDRYQSNLGSFSRHFLAAQNKLPARLLSVIRNQVKKMLSRPVFDRKLLEQGYKSISSFHSFLPEDFRQVFGGADAHHCHYSQFSFLSIHDLLGGLHSTKDRSTKIMIGHSASPTLNHAEIILQLADMPIQNQFLLTLEYGHPQYREAIRALAINKLGKRVEFLEQRMSLSAYNHYISDVGFAIFNFRWQEGLGNILFLLWNGTKVFLQKESSVYRQCIAWGINVFSIEEDLTREALSSPLSTGMAENNRHIVELLFSEEKVNEYWKPLLY